MTHGRKRNLWAGLCALVLAGATLAQSPSPTAMAVSGDPWQTRLPAFSVDGPPRGEAPILLYFTAPWCGFCRQVERGTLAEAEVRAEVGKFRAHKIDHDSQGGLVQRFGVRGIPAFVLTNDRGEVIDRLTGAASKEAFLKWLAAAAEKAKEATLGEHERLARLTSLITAVREGADSDRAEVLAGLWQLAGRGSEFERKTAGEALEGLAGKGGLTTADRGRFWRVGLLHADLAVRLVAANLLRKRYPDTKLDYDPWEDTPVREAAVAAWGEF